MSTLPVIDCGGCGVCCLHMGFPAFNLTVEQLSGDERRPLQESDTDPRLSTVALADLSRWRELPGLIRQEILRLMSDYCPPKSGELDGPCTWFDAESRLCRHHEQRPQVCREFQVGGAGCLEWRGAKSSWLENGRDRRQSLGDDHRDG